MWKYHAVHHSSEELDWISAARFHPVNIMLGSVATDVVLLLAGISPSIFVFLGPFTSPIRPSCRQSQLDARPVTLRDRRPGVSPLASHRGRAWRRRLRLDLSGTRSHVRHLLYAESRAPGATGCRTRRSRAGFGAQMIYPVPAVTIASAVRSAGHQTCGLAIFGLFTTFR
jgi:hypothetical protein